MSVGKRSPAVRAISRPRVRDIAWAAGFYEGEGSCCYANHSTRISVGQVNREPLDRMAALFGGHVFRLNAVRSGYDKRYISRGAWRWLACGARARGILLTLYGMLSDKRREQIRKTLDATEIKVMRPS